jgi:hypothetical protein
VFHYFSTTTTPPFGFLGMVQKELVGCIEICSSDFEYIPQVIKELTAEQVE